MKTHWVGPLFLLLGSLAGCDSQRPEITSPGAGATTSRAGVNAEPSFVPFRTSHYVFRTVGSAPEPGCNATGERRSYLAGEGTATHLGRYTVTLSFCQRPGVGLTDGVGTFVAANGDLLRFTFHGTSSFVPPRFLPFTSYATFTGGTGRFVSATGSAVVTGTLDITRPENEATWVGTISNVGASKP